MFKLVWFGPALSNQFMEAVMTRRARFVESTTFRRRCPSVFMSGGKLSRADDLALAARFLSNVISRCSYNLIKEFRSLFTG